MTQSRRQPGLGTSPSVGDVFWNQNQKGEKRPPPENYRLNSFQGQISYILKVQNLLSYNSYYDKKKFY